MSFFDAADEAAGRAAYEAFFRAMTDWIPQAPAWEEAPVTLQRAWIDAGKAARAS